MLISPIELVAIVFLPTFCELNAPLLLLAGIEIPAITLPSIHSSAMAMAIDNRQQSQLNALAYEPLRYPMQQPQFTNPWVSSTSGPQLYASSLAPSSALEASSQPTQRPTSISLPYSALSTPAPSLPAGSSLAGGSLLDPPSAIAMSQDLLNGSRTYGTHFSAAGSSSYAPPTTAGYSISYADGRAQYGFQQDSTRRSSQPSVPSAIYLDPLIDAQRPRQSSLVDLHRINSQPRSSFSEAMDASRSMLALQNANDITPRNIYGNQGSNRSSSDSYGFPPTHSPHSSISSASYNPSYTGYGSVADSSATDYSSASESVDMNQRTLPRPSGLVGNNNIPPAPQSMMGQFSSKVSSSSQKKHKCKICDKRFTRPSSLQTHMYSHTGEKRKLHDICFYFLYKAQTNKITSIRLRS